MSFDRPPERVTFTALETWTFPKKRRYQYAFLDDTSIETALENADPMIIDDRFGWMSVTSSGSTESDNPVHLHQVVKLVLAITAGRFLEPAVIDARAHARSHCGYCVTDGHHRIRALKFLGHSSFDARLRGDAGALAELRRLVSESSSMTE